MPLALFIYSASSAAQEFLSPGLTPQQVFDKLDDEGFFVVDIRKPAEFRAGHIPGAVNIPLSKLDRRVDQLKQKQKQKQEILIYCINGKRTRKAEPMLMEQGIENLYHLDGAFFAWMRSGLDVEKGWTK